MKEILKIIGIAFSVLLAVLVIVGGASVALERMGLRTVQPTPAPIPTPTSIPTPTTTPPEPPTGEISSFSFEFGSYFPGYCSFEITRLDNGATLMLQGYNDLNGLHVEKNISEKEFAELCELIDELDLYLWDGFSGVNDDILDGYSFDLSIIYDDGYSVEASGYETFPSGYFYAESCIAEYLYALAGVEDPFA